MTEYPEPDHHKDIPVQATQMPIAEKKRYFLYALGVGVLILLLAIFNRQTPPLSPAGDRARPVRIALVEEKNIAPLISGFGRVQPKVDWKAIAEASGKIIYRHPDLEKGRIIRAGEVLLKIDPLDYQLQLARAQADLNASKAQLQQLELQEANLKASLDIEQQRLELIEKELARKENLLKKKVLSRSDFDQQRLSYLSQQSQVLNLKNQLAQIPDNRKVSEAQVRIHQAKLDEARRQLEKTAITLPMTARVASVDFEVGQAVNLQQQLAQLYGIETMEVEAQVALHDARTLLNSIQFNSNKQSVTQSETDVSQLRPETFGLAARVLIRSGNYRLEKPARVSRVSETIDPNQGTVGIILETDQNYQAMISAHQVPLANGLFVEAELEGLPHPHLVVPEKALHGNTLFVLDEHQKLKTVHINILFRRTVKGQNLAAVTGALKAGDKVITTDLLPAIPGMQLKVVEDGP